MPREYKPVDVRAVQWAKVYAIIEEEGTAAISLKALAGKLGLDEVTPELQKSITLLQRQGRIRVMLGRCEETKRPTTVVQPISLEPTVRERLAGADRVEQTEDETDPSEGGTR